MPPVMSAIRTVATVILALSTITQGNNVRPNDPTAHGLTSFYKIFPSEDQIKHFSSGEFDNAALPLSSLECAPDPKYPFRPPSFSCANPTFNLKAVTADQIYEHGIPRLDCNVAGVTFEHLQWATWTHACWHRPDPVIDTPEGRAEQGFQSSALAFRVLVMYQHDKHVQTLNKKIFDLRVAADAEIVSVKTVRDQKLKELSIYYDSEMSKLPKDEISMHRNGWAGKLGWNQERAEKMKKANVDAEKAIWLREVAFWKDSWEYRNKTVELDHLVGEYWERWMTGQTQGGWDWAGMGVPDPQTPPGNFRVDG